MKITHPEHLEHPEQLSAALPGILDALQKSLSSLCSLEKSLIFAASAEQTGELDRLVRKAQPELLRFRGIEQSRLKLMQQHGLPGHSLREALPLLPESSREALEYRLLTLEHSLLEYSQLHREAENILRIRLQDLELRMSGLPQPASLHDHRV